jgi:hypothetical protein
MKQGYNDRLDDSMGARNGKKKQSMTSRRNESKGTEKSMGKGAYSGDTRMMKSGGNVSDAERKASKGVRRTSSKAKKPMKNY